MTHGVWRRALSALLLATTGCAATGGAPEPLVVFSDLDNPPFAEVGVDGVPRGRDVEMMEEVARILERPLEWRRVPFEELLPAAARGEAEVVCATLGVTPEREQEVAFSRPYFVTSIAVVVRRGDGEPQRLEDLSGRRVAAGAGTTSERALRQRLPDCTPVIENEADLSGAERLLAGEVDALVMDAPNAEALVREGAGRMVRLAESLAVESYALALPKSERATLARVNAALEILYRQGRLRVLDESFGLGPPQPR